MSMTAREIAFKALAASRKNGAWSDTFLNTIMTRESPEPREASLATRICYGVQQNTALCDFYIANYSSIKPEKMEPLVLDILRLSVYQIIFLTRIPHHAAVFEGVNMVKKFANPKATALVNAVLRKISSNFENLPPIPDDDIETYLSIKYSHPIWLVHEYCNILGIPAAEALLTANNAYTPTIAQINPLKSDYNTTYSNLVRNGVDVSPHPLLSDCLELVNAGNVELLSAYQNGSLLIQDAAAKLSVMAASPGEDTFLIDGCAAPGGKSLMAAILMNNRGRILSCDIHEKKLNQINRAAQRLGIQIIETQAMDAKIENIELLNQADTVIADVPCSGLGIIRKKPDIRYKNKQLLKDLPPIQLEILSNLSKYVKPGGILLYSTCTVLPAENEDVIHRFLQLNTGFSLEPFTLPAPLGEISAGMLTLWPHIHGTDGFFFCKMRRRL